MRPLPALLRRLHAGAPSGLDADPHPGRRTQQRAGGVRGGRPVGGEVRRERLGVRAAQQPHRPAYGVGAPTAQDQADLAERALQDGQVEAQGGHRRDGAGQPGAAQRELPAVPGAHPPAAAQHHRRQGLPRPLQGRRAERVGGVVHEALELGARDAVGGRRERPGDVGLDVVPRAQDVLERSRLRHRCS